MRIALALMVGATPVVGQQADRLSLTALVAPAEETVLCAYAMETAYRIRLPEQRVDPAVDGGASRLDVKIPRDTKYVIVRSGAEMRAVPFAREDEIAEGQLNTSLTAQQITETVLDEYTLSMEGLICVAPFETRFIELGISMTATIGRSELTADVFTMNQRAGLDGWSQTAVTLPEEPPADTGVKLTFDLHGSVRPILGAEPPVPVQFSLPLQLNLSQVDHLPD
ncbi:hypothetical protein AAD018_014540 [Aestuariibius insulae]|uniref:hypothetical protein n=1 Tax=Aestuariibius insulae TaxID=2058287 RepID=UPI00345E7E8D